MAGTPTEDDIFANDIDPLEGIRQIRNEEISEEKTSTEEEEELEVEEEEDSSEETADDVDEPSDEIDEEDLSDEEEVSDNTDNSDDKEESSSEEVPAFDPSLKRTFKANGQEFEFTQQEMLEQFGTIFGKSVDYTNKTKKIAPYRS